MSLVMKRRWLPLTPSLAALAGLVSGGFTAPALAQPADTATPAEAAAPPPAPPVGEDLRARIDEIDQRSRIVERRLELADEAAAAKAKEAASVTATDKGFTIVSADKSTVLKLRGVFQTDGRLFIGDAGLKRTSDTFLVRRARPIIDATFANLVDVRIMADFGNGQTLLQDGYVELRPFQWLRLRAGKFKGPVGLERLQADQATVFIERGLPTSLVPNRDVGVDLRGEILGGAITYDLGVFNGTIDNGDSQADLDTNFAKDFDARLFLRPWISDKYSVLNGLGFGAGASTGDRHGSATNSALPAQYRSPGQQNAFRYADANVWAWGHQDRLSPQGYYYNGPFGLLAEYVVSRNRVAKANTAQNVPTPTATLDHTAWQVAASVLLNGGKNSFEGPDLLGEDLDLKKGKWGVVELAARYNELRFDRDSFPTYASFSNSIRWAKAWGVAVNWHWSRNLKFALNYEQTAFRRGAADVAKLPADRKTERFLFGRLQVAF